MKSGMNEDVFRQKSPVDGPLEDEDPAEVERALEEDKEKWRKLVEVSSFLCIPAILGEFITIRKVPHL